MGYMELLSDANTLIDSFNRAKKGSRWKFSVQKYEVNLLLNTLRLQTKIREGEYEQLPFVEFDLSERGKTRHIKSMHISDRVVQRAVCDYILIPSLERYMIYDNGASQKGKGISFARERMEAQLHGFYRENGSNKGFILLVDFKKFFDNIPHERLIEKLREKIGDDEAMTFIRKLIKAFEIDVSYMTEEEYSRSMEEIFNSMEHDQISKEKLTGEKWLRKSVGIGSQISQIAGIFYPTSIDNYCKIVRGVKGYSRYMDDMGIIHKDKEYLKNLLDDLIKLSEEEGLYINIKKTYISKLEDSFIWLKIRYTLTESGQVIKEMVPESFNRERRRLKKHRELEKRGKMTYERARNGYGSWRGNAIKFDNYYKVKRMDRLYDSLFIEPFVSGESFKKGGSQNDTRRRKRSKGTENQGFESRLVCGRLADRRLETYQI